MQNNSTYKQTKPSKQTKAFGKPKKRVVSDEYLADVMKKMEAQSQKERHKQIVVAGKEVVLSFMLLKSVGLGIEGEITASVASILKDYPEALKEVLAFYEDYGQKPALAKKLIEGLHTNISDGQLKMRFLWKAIDPKKLDALAQELDGQGD